MWSMSCLAVISLVNANGHKGWIQQCTQTDFYLEKQKNKTELVFGTGQNMNTPIN